MRGCAVRRNPFHEGAGLSVDASEGTRTRTISWQDPVASAALGAEMAGLDYVRAIQSGEIPPPPIAVVMNFSIELLEEGKATFLDDPRLGPGVCGPHHLSRRGRLHQPDPGGEVSAADHARHGRRPRRGGRLP